MKLYQCEFKLPSINIAEVRDYPMTEMDQVTELAICVMYLLSWTWQMISHSLGRDEDAGRWRSGMWDLTSKTSSPRYKHGRDDQEREQSTYCNSLVPWLTSTVLNLMSLFDSKSHHLDIVAYPFIKDLSSISLILKLFSAREISRMQSLLGELFWFNPKRPMRRWKLNLANNLDRVLCKRLQDMCAYEKENRKSEGRPDTRITQTFSEHGNHELWRNVRYQGKPLNYHSEWGIPFVGVVEFDVVTTRRPKLGSKAMKQQDFEIHCAEFRYFFEELLQASARDSSSARCEAEKKQRREIKLESLFATSALRPILQKVNELKQQHKHVLTFKLSADQAVELCLCVQVSNDSPLQQGEERESDAGAAVQGKQLPTMSTYSSMSEMMDEEDAVLDEQVSQPPAAGGLNPCIRVNFDSHKAQARAEIMQRAFPAVIDLDNLWSCMCSKDVDAAKLVKNVGTWSFAYQVEDEHVRKDIRTQHAMEKFLISDVLKARGEA
eukprot:764196-Hanusia_phi.AAC.1